MNKLLENALIHLALELGEELTRELIGAVREAVLSHDEPKKAAVDLMAKLTAQAAGQAAYRASRKAGAP